MPHCNCGFDYARARLKGRNLLSYALIPHESYRAAIRREYAIVVERKAERKFNMIANASSSVGSLMRCPVCGAWLLDEPVQRRRGRYEVLRTLPPPAKKGVQQTKASRSSRSVQKPQLKPSALGSRRSGQRRAAEAS